VIGQGDWRGGRRGGAQKVVEVTMDGGMIMTQSRIWC
jgi:hypothetical protein